MYLGNNEVNGFQIGSTAAKKLYLGSNEVWSSGLYEFDTFTFTNAGLTGRYGPSLAQLQGVYTPAWTDNTEFFNASGGIQEWTVPSDGDYEITAIGGTGGRDVSYRGGYPALVKGTFSLTQGTKIYILVGQNGLSDTHTSYYGGGGGGGTFVAYSKTNAASSNFLVIAGGSGGGSDGNYGNSIGGHGEVTTGNGTSGSFGHCCGGSAGAGWYQNGAGDKPALSFVNGGTGGQGYRRDGGFGGGGGDSFTGGGPGGGASGGSCDYGNGYGGYSLNNGINQTNATSTLSARVVVTKL